MAAKLILPDLFWPDSPSYLGNCGLILVFAIFYPYYFVFSHPVSFLFSTLYFMTQHTDRLCCFFSIKIPRINTNFRFNYQFCYDYLPISFFCYLMPIFSSVCLNSYFTSQPCFGLPNFVETQQTHVYAIKHRIKSLATGTLYLLLWFEP